MRTLWSAARSIEDAEMSTTITRAMRPEQPESLPGFEQLQRFWEPDTARWTVKLLPGEYYVTRADEAITTVLGSCVSACIRDLAGTGRRDEPFHAAGGWLVSRRRRARGARSAGHAIRLVRHGKPHQRSSQARRCARAAGNQALRRRADPCVDDRHRLPQHCVHSSLPRASKVLASPHTISAGTGRARWCTSR